MKKRLIAVGATILLPLILSACIGDSTPATNVAATSATLNATASCSGSPPCYWYWQWGTTASGTFPYQSPVGGPYSGSISNLPLSYDATGLLPDTSYTYEFCGKGDAVPNFVCVSPGTNFTTLPSSVPPPSGIAAITSDCSTDVTSALNGQLATLPAGTINLPENACYSVSNTGTTLTLNGRNNITINGDGAILRQTNYACGSNVVQPVLTLTTDTNITINNLTIEGPGTCGGGSNEGDYGILLGQATPGDTNITFNGVTVENTNGDGLAVYPQLGTCCGINTNVTFENGAFTNIGYHAITPEGVNGLSITGNGFTNSGNFMDLEVDNNYGPPYSSCSDTYAEGLTGDAQCNITVSGNKFVSSPMILDSESNGPCIPQGNLVIENNTMDVNSPFSVSLGGSGSNACPRDNGLTISGNTSTGPSKSPCGGSVGTPPADCSMIEIQNYANVTITNNQFTADDGNADYYPNTLYVPCMGLQGDDNVAIEGNACNNAWNLWADGYVQFPSSAYPNVGISDCGNTWGLTKPVNGVTAVPQTDAAC
jgi:hypothetical protein